MLEEEEEGQNGWGVDRKGGVVQKEARKANGQIMRSPDFKSDGETLKGLKISWFIYF